MPTLLVNLASPTTAGLGYHVGRFARHVAAVRTLLVRRRTYGTAYFSLPGGLGLVYMIPVLATARLLAYRVILHHHSFAYVQRRSQIASLVFLVAGAEHVSVVLCDSMREGLLTRYRSISKTFVLSNCWLIEPGEQRPMSGSQQCVLGHLSNLSISKGLDTVINTFAELRARGINVRLALAGPFSDAGASALTNAARQLFGTDVEYRGALYGDEKTSFFSEVDVFMFASRYPNEAQPLVVEEALAAGCVVVAAERGCLRPDSEACLAISVLPADSSTADFADQIERLSKLVDGPQIAQAEASARRSSAELSLQSFINFVLL